MNDMQFSEAEELVFNEEEEAFLAQLDIEEEADFAAFMAEEAEHDDHVQAQLETVVDGMEELGVATKEECEEIAKRFGIE